MTAPIGRLQVGPGQTVDSDWGNTVFDQSVQVFASAADRNTQWPAPLVGAVSFLQDTQLLYLRTPGGWSAMRSAAVEGGVEVTASDAVSVATGSWGGVQVGTAGASYGTGWRSDATSPIIDVPGWWDVDLSVTWGAGGAGRRGLGYGAAGVAPTTYAQQVVSVSASGSISQVTQKWSGVFNFPAASRVQLWVFQDGGAAVNVTNRRVAIRRVV